jgi:hypothetical protein
MSKTGFRKILAGLQVLQDVLAAYPDLTRAKALEMLREAGFFAPKATPSAKRPPAGTA